MNRCRSCKAPIIWAVTESGARFPIDEQRSPNGNIVLVHRELNRPPLAKVLSKDELETHRATERENIERGRDTGSAALFVSHFATCPDGPKHRRRV